MTNTELLETWYRMYKGCHWSMDEAYYTFLKGNDSLMKSVRDALIKDGVDIEKVEQECKELYDEND